MTERQRNGSVNLAAYTRGNFLPSEQSEIKFDSLLVPDKFKTEEKTRERNGKQDGRVHVVSV